jgi:anti-anti-sigma regulatory factor
MSPVATDRLAFRVDHGVLVVRILDRSLMRTLALEEITDAILGRLDRAEAGLVLDCSAVRDNVTSAFLGKLMALRKAARARGLPMAVCGVRGAMREAFEIAQFDRLIPRCGSAEEAVEVLGHFTERERTMLHLHQATEQSLAKHGPAPARPAARVSPRGAVRSAFAALGSWPGLLGERASPARSWAVAGGAAALVFLAAFGTVALAGRWLFAGPAPVIVPDARAELPHLATCAKGQIAGTVSCASGAACFPDAGARVYAWPARLQPESKFSAAEALAVDPQPQVVSTTGLYRCRTDDRGQYTLRLHALGEVDVLIVSGSARNDDGIPRRDLDALSACFRDAEKLVGGRAYGLTRLSVASKGPIELDWQFHAGPLSGRQ